MACRNFCCSPFASFHDPHLTRSADLTYPIHPVFASAQFTDIEASDYHVIEMPLRLASNFLSLDNVARYIVIMVDGELKTDNDNGTQVPVTFKELDDWAKEEPPPRPIIARYAKAEHQRTAWGAEKPALRRRAGVILTQAQEMVRFRIISAGGIGGDTRHWKDMPLTAQQAEKFPRGLKNSIYIGRNFFDRMKVSKGKLDGGEVLCQEERKQYLVDQFHFATLLVHELAHALENIFTGVRKHETFYQDSNISERGFEMEAAIFGGLLNGTWSKRLFESRRGEYCEDSQIPSPMSGPVMILYDWPSKIYLDMYRERRLKMGVRPGVQQRSSKVSRVPLSFIETLFTMAYWNEVRTSGKELLSVSVEADWGARWSPSWDEIQPWMNKRETQSGIALNSPKPKPENL